MHHGYVAEQRQPGERVGERDVELSCWRHADGGALEKGGRRRPIFGGVAGAGTLIVVIFFGERSE